MAPGHKKRVFFRIPLSLYKVFSTVAKNKGIPKSKLLISWITSAKSFNSIQYNSVILQKRSHSFHLHMPVKLYKKLKTQAEKSNSNVSALLVMLISKRTKQQRIEYEHIYTFDELFNGYATGQNYIFANLIKDKTDTLSPSAKIVYAGILTELGLLSDANQLYEEAYKNDNVKTNRFLHLIYCMYRARTLQLSSKFDQSQSFINRAEKIIPTIHNNQLQGMFYLLNAYQKKLTDSFYEALQHFEKALELLSVLNSRYYFIAAYLQISLIYTKLGNVILANYYERRLFNHVDINDQTPSFINILITHVLARMYILQNRLQEAKAIILKGAKLLANSRSPLQVYIENQTFGMICLNNNNFAEAKYYFEHCEKVTHQVSSKIHFPYHEFFLSFIRSKYDYETSIHTYHSLIGKYQDTGSRNSFMAYMLYTTQYLHANDENIRHQGYINLKRLNDNNPYQAVLDATAYTLSQKQLQITL